MALNALIGAAVGIMIMTIVVFSVVLPVIKDSIATANLTGTEATIAGLIPMFLVLGAFIVIVGVFVVRWL